MLLERTALMGQDRALDTATPAHRFCSAPSENATYGALDFDYELVSTWNLKTEIMAQLEYARIWGARFVVPISKLEVY